ncbi:52 kDa repressor of the inhibitor of the protein kinase-like [Bufo bufo]|uniref:52 kDa repressor of the inhibitor of the protein kinase-like n=1 Tax=Bufo bufo TaxID=8384 RepID=UPI001ABE5DF7|nr:52 kDa repressor of the inhibitor of the protein kinase-like [Bufo bufo]
MPPPKPSGAQFRKRKQKEKSEDEKGAKFMAMFLQKESPAANQNQQNLSTETAPKDSEAFRGSSNKLYTPNNGLFLGLIQLLGKFEPVMRDHLKRVTSKEVHAHYCGNRWCIISDHVKHLTLKKVCATRWECRVESLKAVRYQYVEIHDALLDLEENLDDHTLASEARSLSAMMEDFSFIVTLIIWYDLLFQVHIVSKSMQSRDMEITRCNNLLQNCTAFVKKFRDSGYESAKIAAIEIALALGIEAQYMTRKRPSKKKRLFTYESQDETITDAEEHFKISVFYPLIDNMTVSLERRFSQLSKHNQLWGFLYNIMSLPEKETLQNMCKTLEDILTQPTGVDLEGKQSDIDGQQLFEELKQIQPMISQSSITPLEVLELINYTQSHDLYRNIWIAMRILLTIPITVASSERSFSKLKLIKTYLRTTMTDERLSSLAILSIESELAEKLDYSAAIDAFAAAKSRKVDFS